MKLKPAIICLGPSGRKTGKRAAEALAGELFVRRGAAVDGVAFDEALPLMRELFLSGRPLIGVCAAGILIRALAPVLSDKHDEPPVIALADDGASVVPLLGGHRGANRLARKLAQALGAHAALTTAGESRFGVALDEPPEGWRLADGANARQVMARLLAGAGACLEGDEAADWLSALPPGDDILLEATMQSPSAEADLTFHPVRAALGVGCSRDCPPDELAELVWGALEDLRLDPKAIKGVFSLDLKGDEPAVIRLAEELCLPLRLFAADELERQTPRLATPSDIVFAEVGCHGVAEAAALAAAGSDAVLWSPKRKTARATCAVALAPAPIKELQGRRRGSVMLVSIGPGQSAWRTPEASKMLAAADELVGYGLYLDLLGPLAKGKQRRPFPLGEEQQRCRYALERAGKGLDVALVCSGDAGIYAMGALVYELLDRAQDEGGVSRAARGVKVMSTPGISAFQAAAARAGAPIGHDFCAISLSDLLTPRETILQRLRAAAQGDFVVALYNPVSKRRRELLGLARDILLEHRPANTPALLASNLGRPAEKLLYRPLEALSADEVDMLTVVLIGSSSSRLLQTPDGPRLYTPRGYRNF